VQYTEHGGFAVFPGILKGLQNIFLGEIFLHARIGLRGGRFGDRDHLGTIGAFRLSLAMGRVDS
jgi:hypothetical protein